VDDFAGRVWRLGAFLRQTSALWRPAPFHHKDLPWAKTHPGLHAALLDLTHAQVEQLHEDTPRLRRWLEEFIPGMADLNRLIEFPEWGPLTLGSAYPEDVARKHAKGAPDRDVPGRKWAQVEAFAVHAASWRGSAREVLDWCAGKSHLGRMIGMRLGLPVRALERDPALCTEAERLAARDGVALTAQRCDVLQMADRPVLTTCTLVCALHACGDLHLSLLDQVGRHSPAGLLLAPCCYHRTLHEHYRPRSSVGWACGLRLSREDLRLAVLETRTAGHAQREMEKRRKARLLALKEWGAQHGLEVTDYSPLKDIGRDDDGIALQRACARLGWLIPDAREVDAVMRTGWARSWEVRTFELIRAAVRRPLEVWLVLDMARGLEEVGYAVEVGQFCESALTPRNLMIKARPRPGQGG